MTMTLDAPTSSLTPELKARIRAELAAGADITELEQRYGLDRFVLWGCLSAGAPRGPRQPHFRRRPTPELDLNPDHIAIIRHVAKHRFLRTTHLMRLLNHRPAKKLSENLTMLYRHSYLDRPIVQVERYVSGPRQPYVYALGNRGAKLIAQLDGATPPNVDWTDKNREAGRPFVKHTLLIADVHIGLELALRNRPDVKLISREAILESAPEATRKAVDAWKFRAKIPGPDGLLYEQAVAPDGVFGLDFTKLRKRIFLVLEADRATMPIVRTNLKQTSMQKKFLTYLYADRAKYHHERYGIGNFRVLTVTTSLDRQASMLASIASITNGTGSNLFLFTNAASLAATTDFLSLDLITGKGEITQLTA